MEFGFKIVRAIWIAVSSFFGIVIFGFLILANTLVVPLDSGMWFVALIAAIVAIAGFVGTLVTK
jgi:hypothetical protein